MSDWLISFTPTPGSWGTLIEYRRSDSSTWITPSSPANPTTLISYLLTLEDGYTYYVRVSAYGGACTKKYTLLTINTGGPLTWVADSVYCQQATPMTLVKSVTGFADPSNIMYDQITGRMYVVDWSAVTSGSNIYWFNPSTITTASDVNPVGGLNVAALASEMDAANRKIYISGPDTSGLIVYDIATNTVSNIPFGTNGLYARISLKKFGNLVISADYISAKVTIINATTLSIINSINYTSIPNYTQRFSNGVEIMRVNNEWWVWASQGSQYGTPSSSIARYNDDFSVLIGTIALPGQVLWTNAAYWRSITHIGNTLFVMDFGSSQLMTIDTNTLVVTVRHTFTNRQGKSATPVVVVQDPVTLELYVSGNFSNSANTDLSPIQITYKLDGVTYVPDTIHPAFSYGTVLARQGLTDVIGGVYIGIPVYPTSPMGSATDGHINIFDKSSGADNTGYITVLSLKQINVNTGNPTGEVKANEPTDADYIAPYLDESACPITYDLVCPTATYTQTGISMEYEYSLKPSTYANPALDHIDLEQEDSVTSGILATTTVPKNLYQNGTLSKIGANSNIVNLLFKDSGGSTIGTCSNIFTIT